jgi:hypothetical protein
LSQHTRLAVSIRTSRLATRSTRAQPRIGAIGYTAATAAPRPASLDTPRA